MAGADAPVRRALTALRLQNFRNYDALSLRLDPRPVALFGPNGSGKTNVLEAISCLAPGRGLRRAPVADIARRAGGANLGAWAVSADFMAGSVTRKLGVGQDPAHPSRRLARLDGESVAHGALGDVVRVTWLTPTQDGLFRGPRSERLRYFDRLTLALHPRHGAESAAYERAMRERVRVLTEGPADPAWLAGLEAQMARHGVALAAARADMLRRLQAAVDGRPEGAFPKAELDLAGVLEGDAAAGAAQETLEARFAETLAQVRRRDAAAGRALDGPHRTDFVAQHRAKAMPAADCSTGEQKALLVGIALAHARALEAAGAGHAPLLLVDEAAAHLDGARRAALADEICALGAQAWLTGTEDGLFEAFGDRAQRVAVSDGSATVLC